MSVREKMLEILEGIDIRFKEPLHSYSYTKVGGQAVIWSFHEIVLSRLALRNLPTKKISLGWFLAMQAITSFVMVLCMELSSCVTCSITFLLMARPLKQKLLLT